MAKKTVLKKCLFLSTPSVGRATALVSALCGFLFISIHALRGEGDQRHQTQGGIQNISIHALRGEGDCREDKQGGEQDISIHALRGEGDEMKAQYLHPYEISIHALRGEGDGRKETDQEAFLNFYPRPPWGGRRLLLDQTAVQRGISIHALRGEGDARG